MSERKFNPESYEGKPRHLPDEMDAALRHFVDYLDGKISEFTNEELDLFLNACLSVSPINCGWDVYQVATLGHHFAWHEQKERAASVDRSGEAGETRSEAEGLDPKDESAVPAKQGDAQPVLSAPNKEPDHG